jgi:hypothetical protein
MLNRRQQHRIHPYRAPLTRRHDWGDERIFVPPPEEIVPSARRHDWRPEGAGARQPFTRSNALPGLDGPVADHQFRSVYFRGIERLESKMGITHPEYVKLRVSPVPFHIRLRLNSSTLGLCS